MHRWSFFLDPLQGKTSLSRVIWLYGIAGSAIYGAFGLLIDVADETALKVYSAGGMILSIYVTVATYQCARNCRSVSLRRMVRVSAVISLLLLPLIAYLDFTGALALTGLGGEQ